MSQTRKLSQAELSVLQLLAEGKQQKEVADARGTSINTVKAICSSIRNKLGVGTMLQAEMVALREGIVR